jgi:tetrahydromethanopterin S-methyltransferase subunit A
LAPALAEARSAFVPLEYECLGCSVCYPAIAANTFAEAYPEAAVGLDLCPTEAPDERMSWPPFSGDYFVLRYQAPVAVCTLNSTELASDLRDSAPAGLSIIGTLHTENLGIERLIRNVNANPHIRFLILCGQDTQQRIGHLPGQSLASLLANGLDERLRIIGAKGKRPVLKNVTAEEVNYFRENIEAVNLIGEEHAAFIARQIVSCADRNLQPVTGLSLKNDIEAVFVVESEPLVLDPKGYFVVYPEPRRKSLVLEHYSNQGVLDAVLEGRNAGALYKAAILRGFLSRLDHAAYLGRELARAEQSLKDGSVYVQDQAPEPQMSSCGCPRRRCQ